MGKFDLGPYDAISSLTGARYKIIAPTDRPFMAAVVAEVPDLEMARKIVAALNGIESETQAGWIPVGVRMPDAHKTVLLACSHAEVISTGFWSDLGRFRIDAEDDSDGATWTVTHWMPLPEAPK